MNLVVEFIKFIFWSVLIVVVSKYLLVRILRKIGKLLELKSKTIGNIAGIATSIPELLTVSFSAFTGLLEASTYNILSSNIINTIQYGIAIAINKNHKEINNKSIKIDLLLVIFTIIIPILMLLLNTENNIWTVPIFVLLFLAFYKISHNAHNEYIYKQKEVTTKDIKHRRAGKKYKNVKPVIIQTIFLVLVGVLLYFIGDMLSKSLENLSYVFNISEWLLGILLGFITSLPELITFFESQKHHGESREGVIEATSNLLTSNIMNLFIIQSIGIIIYIIF